MVAHGFLIHESHVEILKGLAPKFRNAVIGAAFARAYGLEETPLPADSTGILSATADAIRANAEKFDANGERKRAAERAKKAKQRAKAENNDMSLGTSDMSLGTKRDKTGQNGTEGDRISPEGTRLRKKEEKEGKERSEIAHADFADVESAAERLGIPQSFATYFAAQMDGLGWMVRDPASPSRTFAVTTENVATVIRGWWIAEQKNSAARV